MNRRCFLRYTAMGALVAPGCMRGSQSAGAASVYSPGSKELSADLVIIGGGTGGFAAALAAARNGLNVILTEETDWLGGQLTAQAVPPDEHPWIESFGASRSYREFRGKVREYYRGNYPLTSFAMTDPYLNPGNGGVSRLCMEPRVALGVLLEMIAPHVGSARLTVLLRRKPVSADLGTDRVLSVAAKSLDSGKEIILRAPLFVDATELGDLLPLTKTEYVTGAESWVQTGEPHAAEKAEPLNMQPCTYCFAMDYLEGEDHTIERPRDYGFWKDFVPSLRPPWPGRLLDWQWAEPQTLKPQRGYIDPSGQESEKDATNLWLYRRIADQKNFVPGTYRSDITLVNWPQNDYLLGNPLEAPDAETAKCLEGAKQLSLSLFYWLQTEAPRPDGGAGWRGLRLRKDIVGTEDGLAKSAYIRESRRIKAIFTVTEQMVGTEARMRVTGKSREEVTAEEFTDSVGVGCYRIDLHPSTGGDSYLDISSLPYQIPLGALLPVRMENLLPACKNLGTTHITNGCFRLHPPEWNIGESVGMLAAFCQARKAQPRQVWGQKHLLEDFQRMLQDQGVEIRWPRVRPV